MLAQLKALSEDVGKLTPDVASLNENLLSKRRQARIEQDLDATEECPKRTKQLHSINHFYSFLESVFCIRRRSRRLLVKMSAS